MPPFVREEIGKFILWRLDQGVSELGLNSRQQAAYKDFKKSIETSIETAVQKRGQIKRIAYEQLQQDKVDVQVLTRSAMTHIDRLSTMINKNLNLFNSFYATLDTDQQAMVNRKIKEKMERWHDRNSIEKK